MGIQLTPAWHAGYQLCLQRRTSPGRTAEEAQRLGLGDFLDHHRPTRKIKDQLLDITKEALDISLAIGTMRDYAWYSSASTDSVRVAGVELVKKLALELYYASSKLTAVAMNVEAEKTTKLQDWLAGDERIAQIGRGAEVAHA